MSRLCNTCLGYVTHAHSYLFHFITYRFFKNFSIESHLLDVGLVVQKARKQGTVLLLWGFILIPSQYLAKSSIDVSLVSGYIVIFQQLNTQKDHQHDMIFTACFVPCDLITCHRDFRSVDKRQLLTFVPGAVSQHRTWGQPQRYLDCSYLPGHPSVWPHSNGVHTRPGQGNTPHPSGHIGPTKIRIK